MRKALGIATLLLAFSFPALAGEIPTPPAPQPEQPQGIAAQVTSATYEDAGATDAMTQVVLNLLISLLP